MTDTVSHYRIVRELGRGGMGQVYLAEDMRLHRMVALKLLASDVAADPRRVQRFLREAHAASIMSHPNIAVIHEIGDSGDDVPFIAMEYVEGRRLDAVIGEKPLELNQTLDIALEIADALDEAHGRGVIHRDLKPSNIIINTRGHVKVLDFGLAKLQEDTSGDTAAPTDVKSDPGLVLGTVHYMSPEQSLGRDVDARSDLFSFGVIVYEMATGRRPFTGGSSTEIIERIVHQQPEAVARLNYSAPPELERIIRKSLEKDREWRYQSAREVIVDLKSLRRDSTSGERVSTPPPAPRRRLTLPALAGTIAFVAVAIVLFAMMNRSGAGPAESHAAELPVVTVAVLPFSSLSAGNDLEHLQYALPDELTTILSYNRAVAVRPFATTRRLLDTDPIEAGRDLRVDKVVTGSWRSGEGQLAVTVEAIDVASNRVVWRDNIDGLSADLIALRKSLSSRVREGLFPALGVAGLSKESAQPNNSEAYALYLKAVSLSSDPEPTAQALALLQRAVALDPDFAPAWDAMALRQYYRASYGRGGVEARDAARAAAQRALQIDPDYRDAARSLVIYDTEAGKIADAYRQARVLLERSSGDADAHFVVSYVLRYAGRLEEAAQECEKARALNPYFGLRSCALVFDHLADYERAIQFARLDEGSEWEALALYPILLKQGRPAEALRMLKRFESRPDQAAIFSLCIGKQPVDTARFVAKALQGLDPESIYIQAGEIAYCGDSDGAFRLLRRSLDGGYSIYPAMDSNPLFESLRRDPRWGELRSAAIRYHRDIGAQLLKIDQERTGGQ
ncbi:MAG: protein kinase domain-containing protein [Thermoanaerobaculia bacterium]